MGLQAVIFERIQQASRGLQQLQDAKAVSGNLAALALDLRDLAGRDWAAATAAEREQAAARIKLAVVEQLIPVASALSMMGVPGVFVYPPCQLAGALALTHVRGTEHIFQPEHLKALAAIVIWGKLGKLAWVQLAELLKPLLSPPVVCLALLPFVQGWTRAVLDQVDLYATSGR